MKKSVLLLVMTVVYGLFEASGQWNSNGNNIFNTNTGNVGIGNNAPTSLLHVAKNMTEPCIVVQNLGGSGGATYVMTDNASGANWKFKATLAGGFKIRDHANSLDVIVVEPNSFANAIYINDEDNIGVGTSTPASSALIHLNSTSKGFLIPRMTSAQISAIPDPENGLQVYSTTMNKLYIFVSSLGQWKEVAFGAGALSVACSVGATMVVNHVAGDVAPVTKTVTYGLVTEIPGATTKCWISRNLGASNQATAADDATEPSAGWYWQFNRKQGFKHDGTTRTPNSTWITSIDESSNWSAANDPCTIELGSGWRIPTNTEWTNVDNSGGWATWDGPWNSPLKLHAAGYLTAVSGSLFSRGTSGYYESSVQLSGTNSYFLTFNSDECHMSSSIKAHAFPLRCLKD